MKNITSRADVFPFPKSFLDHLNRRTKIKLRCRCFVNFFCGDAVFVIFFCGVAVLTVPQCPPPSRMWESYMFGGWGQGGGRPGEKGAGGVREAGEEGAGSGIPKVAGSGRKREKLRSIAQYFAIENMQRGGSQKIQGGNRD